MPADPTPGERFALHWLADDPEMGKAVAVLIDAEIATAVRVERERCAAVADAHGWAADPGRKVYSSHLEGGLDTADRIAAAIRARGDSIPPLEKCGRE